MMEFTTTTTDLKKALSIVLLAVSETQNTIRSHALFKINENTVSVLATDEDKIAASYFTIDNLNGDKENFTIDPKRLQALLTNSDSSLVKILYDSETKSVKINASDNEKAFVSFPSFDYGDFLTFDLTQQELKGNVNSAIFLKGLRFIQGFIPKDTKNKKFSNLFIENGVMYGSDGSNQIGAFQSDFEDISEIVLRKQMLPPIITMIDKIKEDNIQIKLSDKYITFSSSDDLHYFGFRKSIIAKPKLPITIEEPTVDGFNVKLPIIIKKLIRLSLSSYEDIAIKATYGKDQTLRMETMTDRVSYEELPCERISGKNPLKFFIECVRFKDILSLFQASNLDFYVKEKRCILYSKADMIIEKEGEITKKPFIAVALLTQVREEV